MIYYQKTPTMPALSRKPVSLSFAPYTGGKGCKNGVIYPEVCLNFRGEAGALHGGFSFFDASGKKYLVLCTEKGMFAYNGTDFSRWNTLACSTGCTYYDRWFVVSSQTLFRVYFSAPMSTTWTSEYRAGGYVDLSPEQGRIYALFAIGKALYALRKRGVTKLRAESENFNFSAQPVAAAFGEVYEHSVQKVGERLLFLASDGLYAFDGGEVKKIAAGLYRGMDAAEEPDCRSFAVGGLYVLSFLTSSGERRTLFLDSAEEEGWFSSIGVSAPVSDGVYAYFARDGIFSRLARESAGQNNVLRKVWESGTTSFSLGGGKKTLRALTLFGRGSFQLTLRAEGEHAGDEQVFSLSLDGEATVFPRVYGRVFSLKIESSGEDCVLEGMELTAEYGEKGGEY